MTTVNGLPVHILVVHGVVVLVPLTALVLVLCAFWPAARTRLYWPLLALATVTMGLVPIATNSGEWLAQHVAETPLVAKHVELGDSMDVWVIGMFVVAAAIAYLSWKRPHVLTPLWSRGGGSADSDAIELAGWEKAARWAISVLSVILAVGACAAVYQVGDSGAKAVWTGKVSPTAINSNIGN